MATYYDLNEYRRTKIDGGSRIESTGKVVTVKGSEIAFIYQAGIGYAGLTANDVFTVHLVGGRKVITNEASISPMGFVQVNEYLRITQEDGSRIRQHSDYVVRVKGDQVLAFDEAGICYELDGETTHDCYRVTLRDGSVFFTDQNGKDDIDGGGA